MLGFRVSVCLTRFFNDERSYCYIFLDKETYGTIAAFERYLRRQFRLPDPFCLMTSNNLLPSDQTTNIISHGDVITVIPLKKDWRLGEEVILIEKNNESESITTDVVDNVDVAALEKTSKKKKKKKGKPEIAEASTSHEDETVPLKTEKPDSPESYIESESEKKKDSDMDVSMGIDGDKDIEQQLDEDDDDGNTETDELNNEHDTRTQEPQRLAEMQSAIQQLKLKALTLLNDVASQKQVAGVSGGRINKRKRIRKRNKNTPLSVSTPDLTDSAASQPITFKPMKQSASHIRFVNDQPKVQPKVVQDIVRDSDIITKPRIIHAIENNNIPTSRRTSVCGSPEPKNIGNLNVYPASNIILNGNSKMQAQKEQMITIENVKNRLREFPVMDNVFPVVKDLVLFKMLKLSTDYTPCISDFILGSVLAVDKPNGIVKVSIVDGHKECIPTMQEADSNGELIIDVSWGQVTEPRLIFP